MTSSQKHPLDQNKDLNLQTLLRDATHPEITAIKIMKERVLPDKVADIKTKLLKAIIVHSESAVLHNLSTDFLDIVEARG